MSQESSDHARPVTVALVATGDTNDLTTWREWEQTSKGRQQLTWSKGIRQMAGLAAQQHTDEEIADDDLGTDGLLILDRDTWQAVAPVQIDLLDAAARGRVAEAIAWIERLGLAYVVTPAGRAALQSRPRERRSSNRVVSAG